MQERFEEKQSKDLLFRAIAKVVKRHRTQQCKSIYKLSAECAISRSTWRDVELELCKDPAFTTIWKIAEALDIMPEDFIREIHQELGSDFSLSGLN